MGNAIDLNDKSGRWAKEIGDERTDGSLPAEFKPG